MARAKPHVGKIVLTARLPKGVTAAAFRKLVQNNLDTTLWPDMYEEDIFGSAPLKLKIGKAEVCRRTTPPAGFLSPSG